VQFGSFLGSYEFSNLEAFALGEYNLFSQASGNPTFSFAVPYYGFYVQDSFRALPKLTLEMGLREDFQVYPQPAENPAFPLTGQYPNQFRRLAPRFGFAWQPAPKTVVRGGFGQFYDQHERPELPERGGLERAGVAAVFGKRQLQPGAAEPTGTDVSEYPPRQFPAVPGFSRTFPWFLRSFGCPTCMQASLQIEREISENTTLSIGTMWNHGCICFPAAPMTRT
jgi:hypothetical protein